ncbi:RNA polymerase III transcription factor IIIC subunit-domain-containing protein [Aspergillus desertorum]
MAETHSRTAPFYEVPNRPLVCVEHPAIIKNADKAIDTLQGSAGIRKILDPPKSDTPASLVLRPEDVMARPLQSISAASNNILLQVTVPKRTGRKRKRGTNEPFKDDPDCVRVGDGPPRPTAREILRSLRDNAGKYKVEPVGLVERTHVFRGMPDFVFSTTNSPFVTRFREKILPFDFQKMKEFDLDMSKGAISNVDILPPPSFSHGDIPFHYFYRQNPTVRQTLDKAGNLTTINTQQSAKVLTHLVPYDIETVPAAPRADLPAIDTLDPVLRETISIVSSLFATRPAWSRRALRNNLTSLEQRYALRHAVPYAGYIFRSGPWRDAIVAFGHDPRKDPSSRIYQTTMFRILPGTSETARDRDPRDRDSFSGRRHTLLPRPNEMTMNPEVATSKTSHLFTGQPPLPLDGRMWMFCDITDPLLQGILNPPNGTRNDQPPPGFLREECDIATDGWYGNGTMAKMKTIMRHKILAMYEGRPPAKDEEYEPILGFPDHASPETGLREFWLDPEGATSMATALATEVRSMIKAAPAWREMTMARTLAKKGDSAKVRGDREVDEEEDDEGDAAGEGVAAEESEGEEEAEMMEAAAEAVDAAAKRREEDENDNEIDEVDDENEMG